MKTIEFDLPAFWASALINGDYSSFELDETTENLDQLDAFTNYMFETYGQCWCLTCSDDEDNFKWYHDASRFGVLACNVLTYTFDITDRRPVYTGS